LLRLRCDGKALAPDQSVDSATLRGIVGEYMGSRCRRFVEQTHELLTSQN
jgi:hypothetical protein